SPTSCFIVIWSNSTDNGMCLEIANCFFDFEWFIWMKLTQFTYVRLSSFSMKILFYPINHFLQRFISNVGNNHIRKIEMFIDVVENMLTCKTTDRIFRSQNIS